MDISFILLRIIVFAISVPFAYVAALIPAYAVGELVSIIGLPAAWGQYPIGAIVMIGFIGYFQDAITVRKTTNSLKNE